MVNTSTLDAPRSFEGPLEPSPGGSKEFSLHLWELVKSRGIAPQSQGPESESPELRTEFLRGARSYGFELVCLDDHAEIARLAALTPPRRPLQPQQLLVADVLNATGPGGVPLDEYVIEMPRRSSKTTTIFLWAHGRCLSRPGYKVTFSAQNGVKSSQRLREWGADLDRIEPPTDLDLSGWRVTASSSRGRYLTGQTFDLWGEGGEPDAVQTEGYSRGFRVMRGMTNQGIEYRNGAKFLVLKPDAEAYRGEAADVSWIDEAQEIDPEEGEDLLAGIVPLQDTRPGACLVVSGTAGAAKVGILWTRIKRIRQGDPDVGGLDFAAPPEIEWATLEDEDAAIAVLLTVHPGIGTLTTEDKMRKNYRKMSRPQWAREYLSIWPDVGETVVIDAAKWDATALPVFPPRPARVAFGLDIQPGGGSVACIAAAWRDREGNAYVEIVDHQLGNAWVGPRMQYLTRQAYRGSSVAFDKIAEGEATYVATRAMHPRPKLQVQTWAETAAGCVTFMRELEAETLRHAASMVSLNDAVMVAKKREVRGNDRGVWIFTADRGDDVTPLLAAVRALRNWDQHYARPVGAEETGILTA